jgi:enoyl-CoA hydratase/carnithine racemase
MSPSAAATPLHFERRGNAAVVTLNRPERSNALSRELLRELARVGERISAATDLRAVILTGSGDKAFCAGADLKERAGMSDAQVLEQLAAYQHELAWLSDCNLPIVAAINGVALGGGLELALSCTLRVCVPHAVFALPETGLGIIPGAGGTQRLPRLVGPARAAEMILLGRRVDAATAEQWGLVNKIVPQSEQLVDETLRWLAPVVEGAKVAHTAALRALRAADDSDLETGLARERELYETCLGTEDRVEALRAFGEKRAPKFVGR